MAKYVYRLTSRNTLSGYRLTIEKGVLVKKNHTAYRNRGIMHYRGTVLERGRHELKNGDSIQ